MWQIAIVAYQHTNPHPNLPPVRGNELELLPYPLLLKGGKCKTAMVGYGYAYHTLQNLPV